MWTVGAPSLEDAWPGGSPQTALLGARHAENSAVIGSTVAAAVENKKLFLQTHLLMPGHSVSQQTSGLKQLKGKTVKSLPGPCP